MFKIDDKAKIKGTNFIGTITNITSYVVEFDNTLSLYSENIEKQLEIVKPYKRIIKGLCNKD